METSLRYGLMLSNRGPVVGYGTPAEIVGMGVAAEASGWFDSVWCGDAFLVNPRLDVVTVLAAVAARTERVQLGPACMGSFTQRAALDLAYGWASLDRLAGGRTVMVACAGGGSGPAWEAEGRATGVPPGQRRPLMWERIRLLRELWARDGVTFEGEYHSYQDITIAPRPARQPYPIWAATNVTRLASGTAEGPLPMRTLATVGELCDGWMTHSVEPDRFADAWGHVRAAAESRGRDPDALDNCLCLNVCVREDAQSALTEAARFLKAYYGIQFTEARTRAWTAHGPPDQCAAAIRRFQDCGVRRIALRITSNEQSAQFGRIVTEVLPRV